MVSPSCTSAIGPPRAASGAMWPTIRPWVAPEKRPSVISATASPSPLTTSAAVTGSISRRPVVGYPDRVPRRDAPCLHRRKAVLLGVERARGPSVEQALVAGELHDA